MPHSYHLLPPNPAEDQPAVDIPPEDQPPTAEHIEEPQAPAPPTPAYATPAPATTTSIPFVPPMPTAHSDIVGSSTSAQPQQSITISTRDFLTFMDVVRTFFATSVSFATAHATLADRMTGTEASMTQTSTILAQNQAILIQIQSHLGLPAISPYVPAQAFSTPTPAGPTPPPPTPIDPMDVLAAAAVAATPPAAHQPIQAEDASSPTTDWGGSTSSTTFPIHTPIQSMVHLVGGRVSEGSDFLIL